MTPLGARRKAARMVTIVRDHLGWAVTYPASATGFAGLPKFHFAFSRSEARKVRARIVDEIAAKLLQRETT